MFKGRKVIRGVAFNWLGLGFSLIVGFFLSPFVVHRLGNVSYGVWTLANSVISYMALLDLGLRGAVTRFVSRDHTLGKHSDSASAVSAALWLRLWIGLFIVFISLVVAALAPRIFLIPPDLQQAARWTIILTGSGLAITLLCGVFGGVLAALHRFDLLSGISITQTILRAGGVVLLLRSGHGIVSLAIWELTVVLLANSGLILTSLRQYPQLQLFFRWPQRQMLLQLWNYSIYVFVINIATQFIYYTDNLVVGAFVSAQAVTLFAIGGGLIEYLRQLISSLSSTFMPLASSLEAEGRHDQLRDLLVQGTRSALLISLAIGLALFFRGPTFIGLWMGQQYAHTSGRILQILLVSQFFSLANATAGNIAYGLHKHQPVALWVICEGIVNLVLSIFLVRRMGLEGVAWGTVLPSLVTHILFWPGYICKILHMPLRQYFWQSWIRTAIASLPYGFACYFADRLWHPQNLFQFFAQMAALLPVFLAGIALTFGKDLMVILRLRSSS